MDKRERFANLIRKIIRFAAAALPAIVLAVLLSLTFVQAAEAQRVASHGDDCWWCNRESFNVTDPARVWQYLMADITVIDKDEKTFVYLLDSPNGNRVKTGDYRGFVYSKSVSVHVLEISGDWARIEAYDMCNELLEGWVRKSLLNTASPSAQYGIVVDKQTQRLHLYKDGKEITQLLVSTGLPEKGREYNETAAGEYLAYSWTGGFYSGNLYCDMGIRYNGGDLLHLVPGLFRKDGTLNHAPFEPLLGSRASHGCVRVQRVLSPEGINMKWIWDNLKRNTKMIIWDDFDRPMFYPSDDLILYYNENNGTMYHSDQNCSYVKKMYLPLSPIMYVKLRESPFDKLTECNTCIPPDSPLAIDAINESRGFTREQAEAAQKLRYQELENTRGAYSTYELMDSYGTENGVFVIEDDLILTD
ncbi:hypothetical protein FACS18948_6700 [Clostridia bacterium]|nr:hypothetical protein FACS18948_6700 [Clostridia bacterium]